MGRRGAGQVARRAPFWPATTLARVQLHGGGPLTQCPAAPKGRITSQGTPRRCTPRYGSRPPCFWSAAWGRKRARWCTLKKPSQAAWVGLPVQHPPPCPPCLEWARPRPASCCLCPSWGQQHSPPPCPPHTWRWVPGAATGRVGGLLPAAAATHPRGQLALRCASSSTLRRSPPAPIPPPQARPTRAI